MLFNRETLASVLRGACEVYENEDGSLAARRFTEYQRATIGAVLPTVPYHNAGMRLDFYTDAEAIRMAFRCTRITSRIFISIDVYEDTVMTYSYAERNTEDNRTGEFSHTFEKKGKKRVTIYLPYSADLAFDRIELVGESFIEPYQEYSGYIYMMGDSITHGYDAEVASQTYVNVVMRHLDLDGINQGAAAYSFHAESLDPALFEGKRQPDIISIAYGTNDWNGKSEENFRRDIDEFFSRLREIYPTTPVLVITPIYRASHYIPTKAGTFEFAREYLRTVAHKYDGVYVLDGDKMVPHIYDYFRDVRLHPNDAGFATYGMLVSDAVAEILNIRPKVHFI